MKIQYAVSLAVLAGFGLGAIAVQTLHAQGKPPAYTIVEIDVTNPDAYAKEYAPTAIVSGATNMVCALARLAPEGAAIAEVKNLVRAA